MTKIRKYENRVCIQCNNIRFKIRTDSKSKYCFTCQYKIRHKTIKTNCLVCTNSIEITPYNYSIGKGKYCSRECQYQRNN